MEIKNLKNTPLNRIVTCLSDSFANYFIPLPTEVEYWEQRFKGARVDYELSFGCFDNDELVGFIINGIDTQNGETIAFNTGTGVTRKYRGQQITKQIYDYALPHLKENGVTLCKLEVIEQNEVARYVYERIGFTSGPKLLSFHGTIKVPETTSGITFREVTLADLEPEMKKYDHQYSWDNSLNSIKKLEQKYRYYQLSSDNSGYFIINPEKSTLVQAKVSPDNKQHYLDLLYKVSTVLPAIRVINVHENRRNLIDALKEAGLSGMINQYEMKMAIN